MKLIFFFKEEIYKMWCWEENYIFIVSFGGEDWEDEFIFGEFKKYFVYSVGVVRCAYKYGSFGGGKLHAKVGVTFAE